jgi:hypothetical protein
MSEESLDVLGTPGIHEVQTQLTSGRSGLLLTNQHAESRRQAIMFML